MQPRADCAPSSQYRQTRPGPRRDAHAARSLRTRRRGDGCSDGDRRRSNATARSVRPARARPSGARAGSTRCRSVPGARPKPDRSVRVRPPSPTGLGHPMRHGEPRVRQQSGHAPGRRYSSRNIESNITSRRWLSLRDLCHDRRRAERGGGSPCVLFTAARMRGFLGGMLQRSTRAGFFVALAFLVLAAPCAAFAGDPAEADPGDGYRVVGLDGGIFSVRHR